MSATTRTSNGLVQAITTPEAVRPSADTIKDSSLRKCVRLGSFAGAMASILGFWRYRLDSEIATVQSRVPAFHLRSPERGSPELLSLLWSSVVCHPPVATPT